MRGNGFPTLIAFLALAIPVTPCGGATFGNVVAIGGHASDMALDESRGRLYIANYTANCVDFLMVADNSLQRCQINVAPQPGSLSLSPDAQYLLIAHGPAGAMVQRSDNLLTLIHLPDMAQVRFSTGPDTPLAVAFYSTVSNTGPANLSGPGKALVITTSGILTLDPATGVLGVVSTFANLVTTLPMPITTFPGQIMQTAVAASADGLSVWGVADTGVQPEIVYVFNARSGGLAVTTITAAPPLLPRVSVAADGSYAMVGYALFSAPAPVGPYPQLALLGRYPNRILSANITGHAIDSRNNLIYAQIPDATQPAGPPYTSANWPTMLLMDADNLTVRDRIMVPESMVGRAVLNAAGTVLYAISDSGVMVLPVSQLNQYHRLAAQEDVLIQSTFCNRTQAAQSLAITDPGGGHTDFSIASNLPGITVSPSSGTTPATVQVMVDSSKFPALGTTAVTLTISSTTAINGPKTVRVLVNNPDVNQRGTIMNVPGVLTDILPDATRNRFYILRQDLNRVLVFDGTNNQQIAAFRTATTPMKMSFTIDRKYLLVAHNDSQLVTMYDLDQMLQVKPVLMPGGHFALSIAESNAMLAVLARDETVSSGSPAGTIESIDLNSRTATPLGTLGVWQNSMATYLPGMLAPSANGRSILFATGGGQMALYSAVANTFTVGRKDFSSLSGAVAASSMDTYVIGNNVFNPSLVPQGTLEASYGTTAGFYFFDGTSGGYRATATSASDAGVMQNLPSLTATAVQPVSMTEAVLLPTASNTFTRTLAPMPAAGTVIALTTSGFSVLSAAYAASTAPPAISSVVNAANGNSSVAPGGLISVYGSQLSPASIATSQIPLPRALGESCLTVNGAAIPLLFVSSQQINAQLPFNINGIVSMQIHTPGGVSNNFNFTMQSAAPAVFLSGTAGPETGLATIFRADNGQLVTPTNPIHYNDTVVIYLTGMGATSPAVDAGLATPVTLLSSVTQSPQLTLGGSPLNILYAGLVPGYLSGLYQINATVPGGVPQGTDIPLVISQGATSTTLSVRVVK
jgi:uncharacterized protein (TIGR03437 family)